MRRLIDESSQPTSESSAVNAVAGDELGTGVDPATRAFAIDCLRAERPYEAPLGRKQWVLAAIRNAAPGIPARKCPINSSMRGRLVSRRIRASISSSMCWSGMSM